MKFKIFVAVLLCCSLGAQGQTKAKKKKTKPKVTTQSPSPTDVDPALEKEFQNATNSPSRTAAPAVAAPAVPTPAPSAPLAPATPPPHPVVHNRFFSHTLGDLVYIVPADEVYLALDYKIGTSNRDSRAFGFPLNSVHETTNLVDYQAIYGLFDRFNVGITGSYAMKDSVDTDFPTTQTQSASNSGPSEPDFRVTYRVLDSDDSFMNADVFIGYSPNIGNQKVGNTADSGNYLRGRDSLSGGASLGFKARGVEWMGNVTVKNYGSGTQEDATNAQKTSVDGYMVTEATLGARTEIIYVLHPWIEMTYTNVPSISSRSSIQTTSQSAKGFFSYDIGLDFDVIRDSVLIRLDYNTVPSYSYDSTIIGSQYNTKSTRSQYALGVIGRF